LKAPPHLTIGQFLVINTVAGWPLNGVGALLSLLYVRTRIRNAFSADDPRACIRPS